MNKILIIRFSSLGDVILTTPVYKNIKAFQPDCRISVAVKRKYAGVLEGNPHIDQVLALEEGESLISFLSRIRRERFDCVLDLHDNLRSNFLTFFSGIPRRWRYSKAALARRLFVKKRIRDASLDRDVLHRYLEALRPLGIEPRDDAPEIFPEVPARKPGPRILIIQTAFLGDAVLTTPILSALRKAMPAAWISILCTPEIQAVFAEQKGLDEILVMDKRGKEKGVFSILDWVRIISGRFDFALLPHRSFRSALLVWLARIPRRIGFQNSQGWFFLTDRVPFDWKTHDAERNLKLLEPLGIASQKPEVALPAAVDPRRLEGFFRENGLDPRRPWVGMNPGSVWATKRWLPERFAEVADALIRGKNCQVLLFGGEKDREAVESVARGMKSKPVSLCGKTDLKMLATLIARCSLFVTNDSGPMHLAAAAGVPVVAVFGPTTRELGFFPYGEKSVVVEADLECRPCTLHGGDRCPLGHFRCMREVTAQRVLGPCLDFLSAREKQPRSK